jgi:hypothetical protein
MNLPESESESASSATRWSEEMTDESVIALKTRALEIYVSHRDSAIRRGEAENPRLLESIAELKAELGV